MEIVPVRIRSSKQEWSVLRREGTREDELIVINKIREIK